MPDSQNGSFLHGYAGIVPRLKLSGEIHFETSKKVQILYVEILFKGSIKSSLTVSSLAFEEEETLYDIRTRLLNGSPYVAFDKGDHVLPFTFTIDDPKEFTNYSSPSKDKITDGAFISYELFVEIQILGGMFGNKKILQTVSEPINIPCINWENVFAALRPKVLEFEEIISDDLVKIRFDKHAIFIGSSLNVRIETSGMVDFLKAQLIQSETVTCQAQVRKLEFLLVESSPVKSSSKASKPTSKAISVNLSLKESRVKNHNSKWRSVDVVTAFSHNLIRISHFLKVFFSISGRFEEIYLPVVVLDLDKETLDRLESLSTGG